MGAGKPTFSCPKAIAVHAGKRDVGCALNGSVGSEVDGQGKKGSMYRKEVCIGNGKDEQPA